VNIGYDAISLSFDPESCSTRALLHGTRFEDWKSVTELLRSSSSSCSHPMLLPTTIFHIHRLNMERYRSKIDRNVFDTELDIGYAVPGRLTDRFALPQNNPPDAQNLDFENIVKRLHSCQTELISSGHVARFSKDCGEFLIKTIQELNDLSPRTFKDDLDEKGERLLYEIEFSRNACICILSQSQALKERVQSHINLVS
jgi:hypothetical protein